MVGVKEGDLQPPGELTPDGGFAGAGQADEGNHAALLPAAKFNASEDMVSCRRVAQIDRARGDSFRPFRGKHGPIKVGNYWPAREELADQQ